jgi:hypothetical protein
MPEQQIANPAAEESESPSVGVRHEVYINGDTVPLIVGAVVEVITPVAGVAAIEVKRSSTSVDYLLAGVVIGGTGPGISAVVGGPVMVATEGIVPVNFDATAPTAGHVAIQSTTTAGDAHDTASPVNGQTIGTVLQAGGASAQSYVLLRKF